MSSKCQSCGSENSIEFLGNENSKVVAYFCKDCFLVQVKKSPGSSMVEVEDKKQTEKQIVANSKSVNDFIENYNLNEDSFVLELVPRLSVLRNFFKDKNIDCVTAKSVDDSVTEPFGIEKAWEFISASHPISKGRKPDLIYASNVLSHSHDVNEVLEAIMLIMKDGGTFILDDTYLGSVFKLKNRADIANKSDLWFSTHSLDKACENHGLKIVDANLLDNNDYEDDDLIRMRWCIQHDNMFSISPNVISLMGLEAERGYTSDATFMKYSE